MKNYEHKQINLQKDRKYFNIGKIYHRQHDLHDKFGGNRQSGIAPCAEHPYIFLFTSPRGDEFGYEDGWISENLYCYTGEGQTGDMEMTRGNRAIRDHKEANRALYLFKRADMGLYEYIGQFEYLTHEIKTGFDIEKKQRDVIQFVLKKIVIN